MTNPEPASPDTASAGEITPPAEHERVHVWHQHLLARAGTGTPLADVLTLHAPVNPYPDQNPRYTIWECRGDDVSGYEAEDPDWPCRTVTTIAAAIGTPMSLPCPACNNPETPAWPDRTLFEHLAYPPHDSRQRPSRCMLSGTRLPTPEQLSETLTDLCVPLLNIHTTPAGSAGTRTVTRVDLEAEIDRFRQALTRPRYIMAVDPANHGPGAPVTMFELVDGEYRLVTGATIDARPLPPPDDGQ